MSEILNFFSVNFNGLAWLAALLVAMLPIAEAKVAIPFAMSTEIWGSAALSPFMAATIGFIGSILPAFFVILFLRPVFNYLKKTKLFRKIIIFLENLFISKAKKNQHTETIINNNGEQIITKQKEKSKIGQILALALFVAIPLPLAGVWTSSAIAAFSDVKFWPAILAIAFGNLLEVIFVTILCVLLIDSILIVLIFSLVLVFAYVLIMLLIHYRKNKLKK